MEGRRGGNGGVPRREAQSHKQQPGAESVMHVPRKKKDKSNRHDHDNNDDDSLVEIDPQLRYSFHRNYQVSWVFFFFCLPR
jgi:hypothetical protein